LRPKLELCRVLSGVDSTLPGAHYRSREKLKGILFRSKKVFSTAYRRWEISGQMDPECDSFKGFLPCAGRSSTALRQDGKRAAVLFQALRCGTAQEDTDALSFTIKLASDGVGFDEGDDEDASVAAPTSKRQKLTKQMTASDLAEAAPVGSCAAEAGEQNV
jgi:hypothetical protein